MDPTQNQSGTPGPIFSAGAAPEEPPMTPEPSGTGPKNPFSRGGGDIILQPSDDYYSGKSARSKKPLIIGGIIAVVAVIALLIMIPFFNRSSKVNLEQKTELHNNSVAVLENYKYVIDAYDSSIGINPTGDILAKHPETILFGFYDTYYNLYTYSDFILTSLQEAKQNASEIHKYEKEINDIIDSIQSDMEAIKYNADIMAQLNKAFIMPIRDSEGWKYDGCISSTETRALLSNSDKKIASIARKYDQLACSDDIQVTFEEGEVLSIPVSVDENTLDILNDIVSSLKSYFKSIPSGFKEDVVEKLQTIIDGTKPEENVSNQDESEK